MNRVQHRFAVIDHLPSREAEQSITLAFEPRGADFILGLDPRVVVMWSVDLDDQSTFVMDEVDHVATDGRLAADVELERPKVSPQDLFRKRLFAAEAARAADRATEMTRAS